MVAQSIAEAEFIAATAIVNQVLWLRKILDDLYLEQKKSTEDPFGFLQDVRDKDGLRPGEPGYDPRTLYIPAKAWKTFTPFEKQVRNTIMALLIRDCDLACPSFGRSSKITTIQCCSSRRVNSWNCTRRMQESVTRNLT